MIQPIFLERFEKIRHDPIEPGGLVPLDPMGAMVEEMEFGSRDKLKEPNSPLDADAAIIVSPQKKAFRF
jgi:hypothetical protein